MSILDAMLCAELINKAHEEWGCNCGPVSIAACLGWEPDRVRPHLADFEQRRWMNPTQMRKAILSTGYTSTATSPARALTNRGIVRIQWGGPWLEPGVPPAAAYRFTHWVACRAIGSVPPFELFDCNAAVWQPFREWMLGTATRIMDSIPRCDGSWSISHSWEVRLR